MTSSSPKPIENTEGSKGGAEAGGIETPPGQTPLSGTPLCGVCQTDPSRYCCPGCGVRTCSLACVKEHKTSTECSGKRNRTEFVPLSDFSDRELLSGESENPSPENGSPENASLVKPSPCNLS